jgi:hypothetical protein
MPVLVGTFALALEGLFARGTSRVVDEAARKRGAETGAASTNRAYRPRKCTPSRWFL